jgi:hypothetical protein
LKQKRSMTVKPEHYRVIRAYNSPYPDSIFFRKGEKVAVGQEFKETPVWKNWLWCEGNGKKAWVPKRYLVINGAYGVFNTDYDALELSVEVGDELIVHSVVNGFGMSEKLDGTKGWVPMRNLEIARALWNLNPRRHC